MITLDLNIGGATYGHDVSLTLTEDGKWLASTRTHRAFEETLRVNGRTGLASLSGTNLEGVLYNLRIELAKTYEFGGVKPVLLYPHYRRT